MAEYLGNGIYHIGKPEQIWSVKKKVLENAVAPLPGVSVGSPASTAVYTPSGTAADTTVSAPAVTPNGQSKLGWLRGTALPEPADHGCYVVEFISDNEVRVLAYIDWYGRAFTVSEASVQPPAKQEDLFLVRNPENNSEGALFVRTHEGNPLTVAQLAISGNGKTAKYSMSSPGYNFGANCTKLHYFDMMARAYLAFVYRPNALGAVLPLTPTTVFHMLANDPLDTTLKTIADYAQAAQNDPALSMSPSIGLLFSWLEDAGLSSLLQHPAAASNLALARTIYYANIFYIRTKDENEPVPPEALIWGIESALNRFLNLYRTFDMEASPILEQCLQVDHQFMTTFAAAQPQLQTSSDFPSGLPNGQWETRLRISTGIENLLAPFRLEARFRYDQKSGEVLFDIRTPCASLFETKSTTQEAAEDDHAALQKAQLYAMHAGLFYAAVAFEASPTTQMVRIIARPINDRTEFSKPETESELPNQPWIDVAFTRAQFESSNAWIEERSGNPIMAYSSAADGSICSSVPPFDGLDPLPNYWEQCVTLEEYNAPTLPETKQAWNAPTHSGMSIEFNAEHRIAGIEIARTLSDCTSASDAISTILDLQTALPTTLDGRPTAVACTRLMEALTQGTIEPHNDEAIVACFQGDDPCRELYLRAQELEQNDDHAQAVQLLRQAVANVQNESDFIDNDSTVFRVFDSYWSRLLYNLQCSSTFTGTSSHNDSEGKTVQLAPDYLYYSLIDLINELEGGFEESEDAIRFGKAAVALAPTVGVAYRMLGRAYMLIGELDNAIETLQQGLRVMQIPDDIAVAYYQLGYVYWHAGQPDKGVICYAKSIMTSSVMGDAASNELKELQAETGANLPEPSEIDALLADANIPIAPLAEMKEPIMKGLVTALDENLLPAARSLMVVARRNYSQDDALTGVAASLFA